MRRFFFIILHIVNHNQFSLLETLEAMKIIKHSKPNVSVPNNKLDFRKKMTLLIIYNMFR